MDIAKISAKGQITIPNDVRKRLHLKPGDKVLFVEDGGRIIIQNSSVVALKTFQETMAGQAAKAGIRSEEDVIAAIDEVRKHA